MVGSDSISVFAEGTFEEQIQEIVLYCARNTPEDERAALKRPFQELLKDDAKCEDRGKRRITLDMVLNGVKGLGEGSEKEIEGFFNLIYAHLLDLFEPESAELSERIAKLLNIIASDTSASPHIKYRIMSNLFNSLPRLSSLRLTVYNTLLQTATANGDLETLNISRTNVETWLKEWKITSEERSAFLKAIQEAYTISSNYQLAYEYSVSYVRSLPPNSDAGKAAALDIIASALRLPSVFDFDALFNLNAVIAIKEEEMFSLLQIFLNEGLPEFNSWISNHSNVLEKYNLDAAQLERKMRLLTLSSLGFKYVGKNLSYPQIADALQIQSDEVEKWVIDVIRTGLLWGKLSQTTQTLHVTRSTARTFEREQWKVLEERLLVWRAGLADVVEVVAGAKRQTGVAVAA